MYKGLVMVGGVLFLIRVILVLYGVGVICVVVCVDDFEVIVLV